MLHVDKDVSHFLCLLLTVWNYDFKLRGKRMDFILFLLVSQD